MQTALIIDDVPDAHVWMNNALNAAFPNIATSTASTAAQARQSFNNQNYDLAMIDLNLPDGSGIDLIAEINAISPQTVCVVMTIYDDDKHLFPALEAGAEGYLLKDLSSDVLKSRLLGIIDGVPPLSPAIARRLLTYFNSPRYAPHNLTPREVEVLTLIAKGVKKSTVAEMLSISSHTVGDHIKNIYSKLNVSSRSEATIEAARLGLITLN